jgi:acetyltransferase-like isoleucine patch superfamily enzyme
MSGLLKKITFKVRFAFANEYSKASLYAQYYGVNFGSNVRITGKADFGSEPYLISIGNDVTITEGVTFHNHDGGVGVLRLKHPGIDLIKPIVIGNNVFIGSQATIMPGITIGNNVIIGTRSIVTHNVPDNVVVVGTPARVLKTLEQYEEKVLKEAIYLKDRFNENLKRQELIDLFSPKNK